VVPGLSAKLPDNPTGQIHIVKKVLPQTSDWTRAEQGQGVLNFGACHPLGVTNS
jgi:hypothetical protein